MSQYTYSSDVLGIICPRCRAGLNHKCATRTPHRERVWKAKGYRWYCLDCDEMVAQPHIRAVSDQETKTGKCKVVTIIGVAA